MTTHVDARSSDLNTEPEGTNAVIANRLPASTTPLLAATTDAAAAREPSN